jgi:3-methyladenine DNA glycosylase Tag
MAPAWDASPPKDDSGYFEMMSKAIFTAGLNWKMVENKWPNFRKAFGRFAPAKVARFSAKDVQLLMKDKGIVRNEKKIWATIQNAGTIVEMEKEFGSMKGFIASFGGKEKVLQEELQNRFKFMGPSTARTFLWMAGYKLTPTKEEAAWLKGHPEHQ